MQNNNENQAAVVSILKNSLEKIKSPQIIYLLKKKHKLFCIDSELRLSIQRIRRKDMCKPGFILSDKNGFWYSEDRQEQLDNYQKHYKRAQEAIKNFAPLRKRILAQP